MNLIMRIVKYISISAFVFLIVITFISLFDSNNMRAYAWDDGGFSDGTGGGCCGGGGFGGDDSWGGFGGDDSWGGGDDTWTPIPQTPPPSCNISVSPNPVDYNGDVTLTWSSSNATSASISGIGSVNVSGSRVVSGITSSRTFTMTVTGEGGSATCSATVNLKPEPGCTISVSPSSAYPGDVVTLSWNTSNADSASIDHGIGSVGLSGSYTLDTPQNSTTYTMTVTGNGYTKTCSAELTIKALPSCSISADPSSVPYGGNTTLTWSSQNASEAELSGEGVVGLSGSYTVSNLTSNREFVLTVRNSDGKTNTCSTNVVVQSALAPSCSISITPSTVPYGGSATLTWTSYRASSASISGIGTVALSGSRIIDNITGTRTYTMTVTGGGGTSTCSATVSIENTPSPITCSIYASPNPNSTGNTTLYWSSTGATWATLSDGAGYTKYVSTSGSEYLSNLQNGTKRYTLTVGNGSAQKVCTVDVVTNKTTVTPPSPKPVCSITASKTYVRKGEATTLYWSAENAINATFTDDGSVPLSGSRVAYPQQSRYYKLIVTNSKGEQNSCSIYIAVSDAQPVITVSSLPYTGPNDAMYVSIMGLISLISFAVLYRRRHNIVSLFS